MSNDPSLWFRLEKGNTSVADLRRLLDQMPDDYVFSNISNRTMQMALFFIDPRWLEPMSPEELLNAGCKIPSSREITNDEA